MWVLKVKVISLPYIFQVLYVLCFTRPRYQVSIYRTIGPLVNICLEDRNVFARLDKSNRKAMNRNWSNQKANPALKTKVGNK